MKYFEVAQEAGNDYYALIAANDVKEAERIYLEAYSIDEDSNNQVKLQSVKELSYSETRKRLEQAKTEDGNDLTQEDVEEDLSSGSGLLLIDSSAL